MGTDCWIYPGDIHYIKEYELQMKGRPPLNNALLTYSIKERIRNIRRRKEVKLGQFIPKKHLHKYK